MVKKTSRQPILYKEMVLAPKIVKSHFRGFPANGILLTTSNFSFDESIYSAER
jgi:hypothetical protein